VLFEATLEDYKQPQMGIKLTEHPLAERLQGCNSVESVTAILCEQAQDFEEFREKDKVLVPLKKVLTVFHRLSRTQLPISLRMSVGADKCSTSLTLILKHLPRVKAIQTSFGILLSVYLYLVSERASL
jgi:hypothetical protein